MVQLLVTYMEMRTRPTGEPLLPPVEGTAFAPERLAAEEFLSLYRAVARTFALGSATAHASPMSSMPFCAARRPRSISCRVEGSAVGLCEFERADTSDVELTHFGLIPQAQGRGWAVSSRWLAACHLGSGTGSRLAAHGYLGSRQGTGHLSPRRLRHFHAEARRVQRLANRLPRIHEAVSFCPFSGTKHALIHFPNERKW